MENFTCELFGKLLDSQFGDHADNYDSFRFGEQATTRGWPWLRGIMGSVARRMGFYRRYHLLSKANLTEWCPQLPNLEWMFHHLDDDESRRLLVDVVAYRILGHRRVRLPLSNRRYWMQLAECAALADEQDVIGNRVDGLILMKHCLRKLGYPISIYAPNGWPVATYVMGQYTCKKANIGVKPGDVVIDAGACWGDTALYFAHLAAVSGRIYSFEFIAENIEIFKRNIELNPSLSSRIELITRPLWSSSNVTITSSGAGPGSRARVADSKNENTTLSITVDDFVKQRSLSHVDFIKMDIEGAEFEALRGSKEILRAFKPDLALCVYHSVDDFSRLARYLDDLKLGYRFYLGHFTIHTEETVLFVTTRP